MTPSHFFSRTCILALALLAGGQISRAGSLEWANTKVEVKSEVGQKKVDGAFKFKNTGSKPVHIISVTPSCSCITAHVEHEICAPGETDTIQSEMSLKELVGHHEATVAIVSDDAPEETATLTFAVDITPALSILPRFLLWKIGSAPTEQTIEIMLMDVDKVKLGKMECTAPGFDAKLEQVDQAGKYRIRVKPLDTTKPVQASIHQYVTILDKTDFIGIYLAVEK